MGAVSTTLMVVKHKGIITVAAGHELSSNVGDQGIVLMPAGKSGVALNSNDQLRSIGILRRDIAGMALREHKAVCLHMLGIRVAFNNIRQSRMLDFIKRCCIKGTIGHVFIVILVTIA